MAMTKHALSSQIITTPCGRCHKEASILYDSTLEPTLKICYACKELEEKGPINENS